jgi:hypothetical protein
MKQDYMKMIRVNDATHERLKKHGKFGKSFEDIINRPLWAWSEFTIRVEST